MEKHSLHKLLNNLGSLDETTLGLIFSFLPLERVAFLSQSRLDLVNENFRYTLRNGLTFWRKLYTNECSKSSSNSVNSFREQVHYVNESDTIQSTVDQVDNHAQLFRWMVIDLLRSRDRFNSGGSSLKENFQIITPVVTHSRQVPTCFTTVNVLNRHVECLLVGTVDTLQLYVHDYGKLFSKIMACQKSGDSFVDTRPSEFELYQTIRNAHNNEVIQVKFLNSQYFSNRNLPTTLSPSSLYFVSTSKDRSIKLWCINFTGFGSLDGDRKVTVTPVKILDGHNDWIREMTLISKFPNVIASSSRDCFLNIWDLSSMTCKHKIPTRKMIWSMADHLDKGLIIGGSTSGGK